MSDAIVHLTQSAKDALNLPVSERCRRILADKFVVHDQINQILESLDYRLKRPPSSRASGLIVSGGSGAGKTSLAEAVLRRYTNVPPTEARSATRYAVLINMSEAREAKQVHLHLLQALGCPNGIRYTGEARRDLAFSLAREASLKLIVIDEIQDILIGTPRQQQLSLEVIKSMMNGLGVTVFALGTPEAEHVMAMNEHLRERFEFHSLPKWKADSFLAAFLRAFESSLPMAESSNLHHQATMRYLVNTSGGVLTRIVELVTRAAVLSLQHGHERIMDEFLMKADKHYPQLTWDENIGVKHGDE